MPIDEQAQAMRERNEDDAGVNPESSFISGISQREILRLEVISDSGLGRGKRILGSVLRVSFTSPSPGAWNFGMELLEYGRELSPIPTCFDL